MISIPVSARLGQVMADLHPAHLPSDHLEKVYLCNSSQSDCQALAIWLKMPSSLRLIEQC